MDAFDKVSEFFKSFGYKVLEKPDTSDTDCDMYVIGNRRALKVEIKLMRVNNTGSFEIQAISDNQKKCDCVAVVLINGHVFVEKMDEYLMHCSPGGYRTMTWLKLD